MVGWLHMEKVTIFTHGESRGNPGPAAVGVQIMDEKRKVLEEVSESIGNAPDDYAEYFAVIRGLQVAKDHFNKQTKEIDFELCLSSEVVKKQLNNEETITHPGLVPHFIEIHNMRVESFPNLTFANISLKKNKEADRLVNESLD